MKLMKIKKILKRLLQLHPKSVDLSLNRIKRLLKDLNHPERKIKNPIQVVGTNGKFSICSTLREIYETAGYKVNMQHTETGGNRRELVRIGGTWRDSVETGWNLWEFKRASTPILYLSTRARRFYLITRAHDLTDSSRIARVNLHRIC